MFGDSFKTEVTERSCDVTLGRVTFQQSRPSEVGVVASTHAEIKSRREAAVAEAEALRAEFFQRPDALDLLRLKAVHEEIQPKLAEAIDGVAKAERSVKAAVVAGADPLPAMALADDARAAANRLQAWSDELGRKIDSEDRTLSRAVGFDLAEFWSGVAKNAMAEYHEAEAFLAGWAAENLPRLAASHALALEAHRQAARAKGNALPSTL